MVRVYARECDAELYLDQGSGRYEMYARPFPGPSREWPIRQGGGQAPTSMPGEHTFRRIRDDGELAEATTFELGPDGEVTRMVRNTNYSNRVR